ncbi:hypothetical protein MTO96_017656 [Rhipicephalus appendiculatus]
MYVRRAELNKIHDIAGRRENANYQFIPPYPPRQHNRTAHVAKLPIAALMSSSRNEIEFRVSLQKKQESATRPIFSPPEALSRESESPASPARLQGATPAAAAASSVS